MATGPRYDLESTIAIAVSKWGQSWPNEWWPQGNSSFNDCAAFMSWLLVGLPDGGPDSIWVSDIQLRRGYEFHAGSDGVRRGDIVGWYWSGGSPGNYDHTGICTRVVGDIVYTVDANSGATDSVGEYGRFRGYITSYVRPTYSGFAGIPGSAIPTDTRKEEDRMVIITGNISKGTYFCLYDPLLDLRSNKLSDRQVTLVTPTTWPRVEMAQSDFDAIPYGLEKAILGSGGGGTVPTIDYDKLTDALATKIKVPSAADNGAAARAAIVK